MTKTTLLCFALINILQHTFAQYTITGRIADEHDSDVAFANVLLLNSNDSVMVKGAVADENGDYEITYNTRGNYIIQSYMVGFAKSYTDQIKLFNEQNIKIPDIILQEDTRQLDEVVIKATKPLYEMEVGKMVVNVSSSITAAGQSVINVLEKSPGMQVNRQNLSLSLNGKSGVIVLMNGKRNRMPANAIFQLLEGLNASDVEKIEILSIPPAKYDADGDAGFINIIMKKGKGLGTSGSYNLHIGHGTEPQFGGGINVSHNTNKLGLYGSYSFNRIQSNHIGDFFKMYNDGGEISSASTYFDRIIVRQIQNFQFGIDYYASKKTSISGLISGYENVFSYNDGMSVGRYEYPNAPDTLIYAKLSGNNDWKHLMGNINLQHAFSQNHVLNLNLDYLTYKNYYPSSYENKYLSENQNEIATVYRRILKQTPIDIWVSKIDYTQILNDNWIWDSGWKGTFSHLSNDVLAEDRSQDDWMVNEYFSDQSEFKEDIFAIFTSIDGKLGEKTTIRPGLRYEHTSSVLSSGDPHNNVDRKYGDLFPSIFFSHKLKKEQTIQLSYGRRITRPTFNDMAPYIVFIDPNTLFSGNPGILPTYSNSINAGYSIKSYSMSVNWSVDKNAIYKFQPDVDIDSKVLLFRPTNIDMRKTLSVNLTLPFNVAHWWELQNNLTFIYQQLKSNEEDFYLDLHQELLLINLTQTFKLPRKFAIEVAALYNSPAVNGYTTQPANGFLNIGIQKVFKNESTLRFSCNDIFETTLWQATAETENGFYMDSWIKFDKRIFTLSYSQSLGNKKAKGARKRSVGSEEELKRVTN